MEPVAVADPAAAAAAGPSRGRGRAKSRGGLGKYLRARGRGRGRGRPAEFAPRLLLEGEQDTELDEEEAIERERKYARRQLASNADRYVEPEPELGSDGEPIVEPEVDLSAFLERQRLSAGPSSAPAPPPDEDDDIDTDVSPAEMAAARSWDPNARKGRVQQVEWDASLEELSREKAAADAARDLKARFKQKTERERARATAGGAAARRRDKPDKPAIEAPALPTDAPQPPKSEKQHMEDFLDDLLG